MCCEWPISYLWAGVKIKYGPRFPDSYCSVIGATLALALSLLKTMVLLYITIRVDLATSYQSRPHLDENTLKSTFLKMPSYMCAHT